MSRLDSMIRRLTVQRASLDWAMGEIRSVPGPVLEFGLGNGRSFDHLRARLPDRDIFVFERSPAAHPASTPTADRLIIGNLEDTLPGAPERFALKEHLGRQGISVEDMVEAGLLISGDDIPVQFIQMVPYVLTIVVLAGFIGSSRPPRALGMPYQKEK